VVEEVIKRLRQLALLLVLLGLPADTIAHQLDEYLQTTIVAIEPGEIRLKINLTPGMAIAEKLIGLIDGNHDGVISTNESGAYAELVKRELAVRLDGRHVALKLAALTFPEPAELRGGVGIIQLEYSVAPGALDAGMHKFTLENRHQPVASVYLFNAGQPQSTSIQIKAQTRNENQSTGEIAFDFRPPSKPNVTAGVLVSLATLLVVFGVGAWQTGKKHQPGVLQQNPLRG
jgi:hypothetical protein